MGGTNSKQKVFIVRIPDIGGARNSLATATIAAYNCNDLHANIPMANLAVANESACDCQECISELWKE